MQFGILGFKAMKIKNRIALTLTVLFVAWPFAHRVFAEYYHINPWKYFGWAMYLVPAPAANVDIYGKFDGQLLKLQRTTELKPIIDNFLRNLANRGKLARPDELARFLFANQNSPEELKFILKHRRYDWHVDKYEVVEREVYYNNN